jgi:hypothetical protein
MYRLGRSTPTFYKKLFKHITDNNFIPKRQINEYTLLGVLSGPSPPVEDDTIFKQLEESFLK